MNSPRKFWVLFKISKWISKSFFTCLSTKYSCKEINRVINIINSASFWCKITVFLKHQFYTFSVQKPNRPRRVKKLHFLEKRLINIYIFYCIGFEDQTKLVLSNKEGIITDIIINGEVKSLRHTFGYYEGKNKSTMRLLPTALYSSR